MSAVKRLPQEIAASPRKVYDAAHHRWFRRAHERAMTDPTYAEIEARRASDRPDSKVFLSSERNLDIEHWQIQREIMHRLTPRPLGLRALASLAHRHPIATSRRWYQRARYGFAESDTYSTHNYLARIIPDMVLRLRERNISHPDDLSPSEWDEVLDAIIAGFAAQRRLINLDYDVNDTEEIERLRALAYEGFHQFNERFEDLWD